MAGVGILNLKIVSAMHGVGPGRGARVKYQVVSELYVIGMEGSMVWNNGLHKFRIGC